MELLELQIRLAFKLLDEVAIASAIAPQSPRSARGQVARVVGGRAFTSLRLLRALLHYLPHRQGAPGEVGGQARAVGEGRLRLESSRW